MKVITETISHSPGENEAIKKVEKKAGKRIGFNYIILESLKQSQKNDVVKCLYIRSLLDFGICVIKEGSSGDTKDRDGRDIRDRLMWQKQLHEQLQDAVRVPRLLGSFEENGNYYLVIERIKGKSLYKLFKEKSRDLRPGLLHGTAVGLGFLSYMLQIVALIEKLHQQKVVHRDVTAANFIVSPQGKVAIIDMELSYSIERQFPWPPFKLGTYGYMSPEQEATSMPTEKEDIFSIGALLLQIWTGISPHKLGGCCPEEMANRIMFFIPDKIFAETVIACMHPQPEKRPSLHAIREVIACYKADTVKKIKRAVSVPQKFSRQQVEGTIQKAINALSSPLLAHKEKGWFSENKELGKPVEAGTINKAWYASFNRGAAGVIYLLAKAQRMKFNSTASVPLIERSMELIQERYINRMNEASPSLHFGSSGIAVCLAAALNEGLLNAQKEYFQWIQLLLEKENMHHGFMYGIAGQGIGYLRCAELLHSQKSNEVLSQYAAILASAQEADGSWTRSVTDNKKRITRGFAHGVAGIVYFMLEYSAWSGSAQALSSGLRGLQWLTSKGRNNEYMHWRTAANKEIAPWWCGGGPGIALSYLKAYSITGENQYRHCAVNALNVHDKQVVNNNLSQCHGLSGLGEIYLQAFSILKSEEWLERAEWLVQVIMNSRKDHPVHGSYWLVEHERQPVADFMTGNSGVIHFLLRSCYPEQLGFPLLDR